MKKQTRWGMGIAAAIAGAWLLWKLPSIGRGALFAANEAAAVEALRRIHAAELARWQVRVGMAERSIAPGR